eukprot:gene13479-9287_t
MSYIDVCIFIFILVSFRCATPQHVPRPNAHSPSLFLSALFSANGGRIYFQWLLQLLVCVSG